MAKLTFSPRARQNLRDIADWIAADNPERAMSFVAELRVACRELTTFPYRYPQAPQFGVSVRRRTYGSYHIIYMVTDGDVAIITIVHTARDPDTVARG